MPSTEEIGSRFNQIVGIFLLVIGVFSLLFGLIDTVQPPFTLFGIHAFLLIGILFLLSGILFMYS